MARVKYKWRIAGFIFKAICSLFIAAVMILLFWRIIDNYTDTEKMNTVIPNEKLCEAYEREDGKLSPFTQEQTKYTRGEKNSGYFAVTQSLFIPEADQLQFVFRYNNSTLKYTKRDYNLAEEPSRDEDVYDVTVLIMYDLTPDNKNDNDGKTPDAVRYERFYASDMISDQKTLYNYRKFVFDGIKLTDDVIGVYVDLYYKGDVNYDETPYGSLLLYYNGDKNIPKALTSADKSAIENWTKSQNNKNELNDRSAHFYCYFTEQYSRIPTSPRL